jgi:hypothetical protein
MYVFGGLIWNERSLNDLWKYNFRTGFWTYLSGSSEPASLEIGLGQGVPTPSSRGYHSMAMNRDGDLFVYSGIYFADKLSQHSPLDLWRFHVVNQTWNQIYKRDLSSGKSSHNQTNFEIENASPNSRILAAMTFSPFSDTLYLFGGYYDDDFDYSDLWKLARFCSPGFEFLGESASFDDSCTQCRSGRFSSRYDSKCQNCSIGKFVSEVGKTECLSCPVGKSSVMGSQNCEKLDPAVNLNASSYAPSSSPEIVSPMTLNGIPNLNLFIGLFIGLSIGIFLLYCCKRYREYRVASKGSGHIELKEIQELNEYDLGEDEDGYEIDSDVDLDLEISPKSSNN